jgi:uncharacterized membrane protein
MRRFVQSETYARTRLVSGSMIIGMFRHAGLDWRAVTGYVLGLALIGLGIMRYREYAARPKGPTP